MVADYPEIRIRVKRRFLRFVDESARKAGLSRSDFVKQAISLHIRRTGGGTDA